MFGCVSGACFLRVWLSLVRVWVRVWFVFGFRFGFVYGWFLGSYLLDLLHIWFVYKLIIIAKISIINFLILLL